MTLSLKWKGDLIYRVTKSCDLIGMHCTVWQDKLLYGRVRCHMSSPWLCYIVWPKTVSSHSNVTRTLSAQWPKYSRYGLLCPIEKSSHDRLVSKLDPSQCNSMHGLPCNVMNAWLTMCHWKMNSWETSLRTRPFAREEENPGTRLVSRANHISFGERRGKIHLDTMTSFLCHERTQLLRQRLAGHVHGM